MNEMGALHFFDANCQTARISIEGPPLPPGDAFAGGVGVIAKNSSPSTITSRPKMPSGERSPA
jgi:hypothetical protein